MIPSITSIEAASWETPLVLRGPFAETIPQAHRLGYPGIELHIKDSDALDHAALAACLRENGVQLTSIGTGPSYSQDRVFLTHPDASVRAEALRRMQGHIRLGAELGAVVIVGLMKGQRRDCGPEAPYDACLDTGLEQCLAWAEAQGVILAFEVIDRFESDWLNTVEEGMALLDRFRSPSLTLHLDTFHMNIEEADLTQAILRAKGHIGHVHVADSDRWYPGHAHYDFQETFAALRQAGYQGAVALESFLYPDPETAARRSLERIAPLCAE